MWFLVCYVVVMRNQVRRMYDWCGLMEDHGWLMMDDCRLVYHDRWSVDYNIWSVDYNIWSVYYNIWSVMYLWLLMEYYVRTVNCSYMMFFLAAFCLYLVCAAF